MKQISLIIDGKEVRVAKGTTILEAAKSVGIEIPHFCYYPELKPTAACRMCLVEVEGAKDLIASCAFQVAEGMVVRTQTERVIKARKLVIELLLSNHPLDCLTCESNGACKLQKYAYQLRISSSSYQGERHSYVIDESNPFFIRDYNKCILCGRCVMADKYVQFIGAIDYTHRGFNTKISSPFDRPLQETPCIFCGECVAVCPVGALMEKNRLYKGRIWELKKVNTICPYCGVGCSITLWVKDNEVIRVTSEGGVNKGSLCVKGRFGYDFINHSDRLTTPLVRKKGKLVEASWEEAIKTVADNLHKVKKKFGASAIAGLSSAKCTNEENYLFQKMMRAVIGTNNVDHCARL